MGKTTLWVVDDIVGDPGALRAMLLGFDWSGAERANYPGRRIHLHGDIKAAFQDTLEGIVGLPFTEFWASAQLTTCEDRSWVHSDVKHYAAVIFLTPNAPSSSGTGFFRHRDSGVASRHDLNRDAAALARLSRDGMDATAWDLTGRVGNVYNRLVAYPGDRFHSSLDYFGHDTIDGRLTVACFANTGPNDDEEPSR